MWRFPGSENAKRVGVLVAAGLCGWGVAWLMLRPDLPPQDPVPEPGRAARRVVAPAAVPGPSPAGIAGQAAAPAQLEQLMQRQAQVSRESVAQPVRPAATEAMPMPSAARAAALAASRPGRDPKHEARRRAIAELQARTLAELRAVPAGDTKQIVAVMTKFDAQMRAAGAPSVLDVPKMRQVLEAADRVQQLSRELVAESNKGRTADPARIAQLSSDIQAARKLVSQPFIKQDVPAARAPR